MWREGGIEADQWRRLRPRTAEGLDGSPQAERDLKFTRQATSKIGGVCEGAAKFLRKFFWRVHPDEHACSRASQHCPKIVTRNRGTRRGKPRR